MSFLDEIIDSSQIKDIGSKFKIIVLDNLLFALEGYEKIITFSDTLVAIGITKHERVQINGIGFCVKQLSKGEIIISGKIGGITFD